MPGGRSLAKAGAVVRARALAVDDSGAAGGLSRVGASGVVAAGEATLARVGAGAGASAGTQIARRAAHRVIGAIEGEAVGVGLLAGLEGGEQGAAVGPRAAAARIQPLAGGAVPAVLALARVDPAARHVVVLRGAGGWTAVRVRVAGAVVGPTSAGPLPHAIRRRRRDTRGTAGGRSRPSGRRPAAGHGGAAGARTRCGVRSAGRCTGGSAPSVGSRAGISVRLAAAHQAHPHREKAGQHSVCIRHGTPNHLTTTFPGGGIFRTAPPGASH